MGIKKGLCDRVTQDFLGFRITRDISEKCIVTIYHDIDIGISPSHIIVCVLRLLIKTNYLYIK